jgi:hypothetical protein
MCYSSTVISISAHLASAGASRALRRSVHDGKGNDSLVLSAQDVLDLGSGTFDPNFSGHDVFGKGDAVRVDGDTSDRLNLTGGGWSHIDPSNGPDNFDVFTCHAPTGGGNVYVLVQEDVAVTA